MKKVLLFAASAALMGSAASFAAPNITNVNQKGSLLVFPLIEATGYRDTLVMITNDFTNAVNVKCYYGEYTGDVEIKPTQDFQFVLTKNQPFYWFASSGSGTSSVPDFPNAYTGTGQLVCWAVSRGGGNQIAWNHLSGVAKIIDENEKQSWEYSAYSFFCRNFNGASCGTQPGRLELTGASFFGEYDACPQYLIGQMVPEGAMRHNPNKNYLSVSSCNQDLSPVGSGATFEQDVVFDFWNESEVKFTGAQDTIDSWWRIHLGCDSYDGYDGLDYPNCKKATYGDLGTFSAYYRAESEAGYGLLGVQVQKSDDWGYAATTVHHAGRAPVPGEILWRTGDDRPPLRTE